MIIQTFRRTSQISHFYKHPNLNAEHTSRNNAVFTSCQYCDEISKRAGKTQNYQTAHIEFTGILHNKLQYMRVDYLPNKLSNLLSKYILLTN